MRCMRVACLYMKAVNVIKSAREVELRLGRKDEEEEEEQGLIVTSAA